MTIPAGTYRLGPADGTLAVHTKRTGAAAKAGHNLLIHVTAWEATIDVAADGGDSRVELAVDATSLRVREGRGGMQALGDDDKASIEHTIDDEVLKRQDIRFHSTRVERSDGGLHVEGELTLRGATRPIAFDLASSDGALTGSAVVTQSAWGLKPYSTLFGALKVVDEVEVTIAARLPASS